MCDNNNDNINIDNAGSEADETAERIAAVEENVRSVPEHEEPPPADVDDDMSQRFAAKFNKVKANRKAVLDILEEAEQAEKKAEDAPAEITDTASNTETDAPIIDIPGDAAAVFAAEGISLGQPAEDAPPPIPALKRAVRAERVPEPDNAPAAAPEFVPPAGDAVQPVRPEKKKSGKKKKKKKKPLKRRIRELFPEKGDKPLEIVRKCVFLTSVVAIVVCGYMVGDYYLDLWHSRMTYDDIDGLYHTYEPIINTKKEPEKKEEPEKVYNLLPGAQKLLDINSEIVGYLTIPTIDGDPIVSLPVVQAKDNYKYLNIDVKGNEARAGALFLDWRNFFDHVKDHRLIDKNSDNLIVYGHNMADESMFGNLKYYYRNVDYYGKHPIIQFNSNYEMYTYKIFAFFIVDAEDDTETKFDCWNTIDFNSEEEFYKFVNEAKRRTIRTNDIDVQYSDPLLTLSTCNTLLGDRGRLILLARRVRPGEDAYEGTQNSQANPNIKWPTMYFNTRTNEKYDPDAPFVPYGPKQAVKEVKKETETDQIANTGE
jgi:sortase B